MRNVTFNEITSTASNEALQQGEILIPITRATYIEDDQLVDNNELVGDNEAVAEKLRQILPVEVQVLRDRAKIKCPIKYEVDVAEYITSNTYDEAMNNKNATKWVGAINE